MKRLFKLDPWTAAMQEPGEASYAFSIVQSGEDHGLRIRDLDDKEGVIDSLETWPGVEIE